MQSNLVDIHGVTLVKTALQTEQIQIVSKVGGGYKTDCFN